MKKRMKSMVIENFEFKCRRNVKTDSSCLAFQYNQKSSARIKINPFFTQFFSTIKALYNETLMKQKLVVTEKKKLCLVTNQSHRLNIENTDYHNYEARVNTKHLPFGWSCTFFKFCFETFMKENKMIVTELKGLYLLTNQSYKLIFGKPGLSDVLGQRSKRTTSRLDTLSLV